MTVVYIHKTNNKCVHLLSISRLDHQVFVLQLADILLGAGQLSEL